jgi:hypothetical protein
LKIDAQSVCGLAQRKTDKQSRSRRMSELPKKLYHAAPECVLLKIDAEGLRSHWGEIYAAETPADALTFMWFRLLDHVHPENIAVVQDMKVPALVRHDSIHVWEIRTSKTDRKLWSIGTDHSAAFFGNATSWAYASKSIPRKALGLPLVFSREAIETAAGLNVTK